MIKRTVGISLLAGSIFLTGCIGGKSVDPTYLRISNTVDKACEKVDQDIPRLVLKHFTSLPALDRETVIVAHGAVLQPDYRWSWEGTPGEIFDLNAGYALSCMDNYEIIVPYRPGLDRDLVLSGVITEFELHRGVKDKFKASVRYSLLDGRAKNLLARKEIKAEIPLKTFDSKSIAAAAQQAVDEIMDRTIEWIDAFDSGSTPQEGE